MRKIEKQMLNAISSKVDKWMNNNTSVFYVSAIESGNPFGARSEVYLHGNHIADYWHESGSLEVNSRTLAQWSTPTTKSRLRALGANVATRKGITYLNNVAI
jgi:hypothetical protein